MVLLLVSETQSGIPMSSPPKKQSIGVFFFFFHVAKTSVTHRLVWIYHSIPKRQKKIPLLLCGLAVGKAFPWDLGGCSWGLHLSPTTRADTGCACWAKTSTSNELQLWGCKKSSKAEFSSRRTLESAVYWGLSWLSLALAAQHMQIVLVDAA